MEDENKKDFVEISKIIYELKEEFSKRLEKELGNDPSYYPIRITVWVTNENFVPVKKLVEIDEREIEKEVEE
jgi:hypothetical protein